MIKSPKKSKSLTRAGNRPATISAQQTIPYVRMLPDGICQLSSGVYTKTLEYEDINYSVASAEDQTAVRCRSSFPLSTAAAAPGVATR